MRRNIGEAVAAVCLLVVAGGTCAAEPGLVAEKPASGRYVKTDRGYMVPYKTNIPGSPVEFEMQPIPGGVFKFGSPNGEANREPSEGPQVEVEVQPFWLGTYEVTWAEYKRYMAMNNLFRDLKKKDVAAVRADNKADAVTAPSNLYDPTFTFQFGEEPKQPAITMSQFAAKQYTKWLSGVTGQFFRLPSEAEWEYACRAGTTTAYSFGDDASKLSDHAWFRANAEEKTQLVGQKKPNPWGLFDMHGNVSEWVLDEFVKDGYGKLAEKKKIGAADAADTIAWPTKLFPRVVRGGSWDDEPETCRSATRRGSHDDDWRAEDPNFPQSPWWFTSNYGLAVGFRVARPLSAPAKDGREKFWGADLEQIQADADDRIDNNGRGNRGVANEELKKALETLK